MNELIKKLEDVLSWNEGDIYFWRWKDTDRARTSPYHCCSCIAVIESGFLRDTYWGNSSDGRNWTQERAVADLDLTFKGNLNDLEAIKSYELPYYEEADTVDMRHANSSHAEVYRRKGSQRSKARTLAHIQYAREKEESAKRMAEWALDRLAKVEASVLAGDDLNTICI